MALQSVWPLASAVGGRWHWGSPGDRALAGAAAAAVVLLAVGGWRLLAAARRMLSRRGDDR